MQIYRNQIEMNGVNGCSNRPTSSGRAFHEQQVLPDAYQTLACKTNSQHGYENKISDRKIEKCKKRNGKN